MTDPDLTREELDQIERLADYVGDPAVLLSPSRVRALVRMARKALPKPDRRAECPMQNGAQCCNDPEACLAAIRERIGALATMDDPDEMIACISDIEELVREEPRS